MKPIGVDGQLPRPDLIPSAERPFARLAEMFPDNPVLRDQLELFAAHFDYNRRLEAQVWKRFADAAGCPGALTEEDRRYLEDDSAA
ncbi:MAG: hypothetical protein AB1758_15115 [Candidatus Eremiobacterota bacterium]